MNSQTTPSQPTAVTTPRARAAFRWMKVLAGGYLGLSVLTLVVAFVLRDNADEVNPTVWVRGTIVVASAVLTLRFLVSAARGARRSYLRLRIISLVMPVAIAVIIALPGLIPPWMKIEQAMCGVLLLGVALIANRDQVRVLFRTV